MKRRTFIHGCLATPLLLAGCQDASSTRADTASGEPAAETTLTNKKSSTTTTDTQGDEDMYGIIGKIKATDGNREKLIEILLGGTKDMPGCKLYAISADSEDENGIWITEIWDCEESHQASLQLPDVQKAIAAGKPMIAGFEERHVVTPIGGFGVNN